MTEAAEILRPMNFEEFMEFVDERPDGERWELVNGVPVMQASPMLPHQLIVAKIVTFLMNHKNTVGSDWLPVAGHTVPAPPEMRSATIPDVVVVRDNDAEDRPFSPRPIAAVEVMSRSNTQRDRHWRLSAYAAAPSIEHYLIVEQARPRTVLYIRSQGWRPVETRDLGAAIDLPALGVTIPLATIYRWTRLDPRR
jgi:Uma2 family endonuclease